MRRRRTLAAGVVLPDVGNVAVSGTPAMHIFGMATS